MQSGPFRCRISSRAGASSREVMKKLANIHPKSGVPPMGMTQKCEN
jgi:hypothetical protein